jgi:hypothetical protein
MATTSLQPVPALDRRITDRGTFLVQRQERRIAGTAPQRGAIRGERIDLAVTR